MSGCDEYVVRGAVVKAENIPGFLPILVRFVGREETNHVHTVVERLAQSEHELLRMTDGRPGHDFASFYRSHYSLILTTVGRRLNDHSTAEDVTSEVFRVAWSHYQTGGEMTLPWLYTVARNVVGNEYRRSTRSAALTVKAAGHADDVMDDRDDDADVRRAMMELREADREILFMAYWEDLSGAEIATILGCKVPTVWVRLNRARSALRAHLDGPFNDAVEVLREKGAASHG